jgi:2',3'-cyclic-nucleotide 2'-phosphodiesterase (5'-nucleotidase family)
VYFKILHTNDIHSRFENFAKASKKIKELRDENTLVLDAGDFNDFMRLELQGTNGKAGAELISAAGYDAISVGNNEGFSGIEPCEVLATSGSTTFLSCNIYKFEQFKEEFIKEDLKALDGVKRSVVIEKGGVKFLIIGASPFGTMNQFLILSNMWATNPKEEIEKEIEVHRDKYDICILLSHCGINFDMEIAPTIDGIDIIIGGHSHTLMEKAEKVGNTIIHQSGSFAEHLGILEFEVNESNIVNYNGNNIKLQDTEEDETIINILKSNKEKAIVNLSKPLYEIEESLWNDITEENPISNLLADALKDVLNCEIGLINSGVLNGGIKKGPVSKKKLLEICPSPLNPTYMEIKGKHLREAFQMSLDADFCMQDGRGPGFRGKYLGKLHLSGGVIEYKDRKVSKILIDGNPLDDEKIYTVATSDYLQRGTGYESLSNNINRKYNEEYLRDTLREYLCKNEYITKAFEDRWKRK